MDAKWRTDGGIIEGEQLANETATFFPSIDVNVRDIAAFAFSASGEELYAGGYMTIHDRLDNAPGDAQCLSEIKAGTSPDEAYDGIAHWGKYLTVTTDPLFEDCFWFFIQHTAGDFHNAKWATHWAFIFPIWQH